MEFGAPSDVSEDASSDSETWSLASEAGDEGGGDCEEFVDPVDENEEEDEEVDEEDGDEEDDDDDDGDNNDDSYFLAAEIETSGIEARNTTALGNRATPSRSTSGITNSRKCQTIAELFKEEFEDTEPEYESEYESAGSMDVSPPSITSNTLSRHLSPPPATPSAPPPVTTTTNQCSICTENYPATDSFPILTPTCTHTPLTCSLCVTTYLQIRITQSISLDTLISGIKCPNHPCPSTFTYSDIQRLLPHHLFRKYDEKLTRFACMQDIDNWQECLYSDCGSGQVHESGNAGELNIMTCVRCEGRICVACQVRMHEGLTCEEFKRGLSVDEVAGYRAERETEVDGEGYVDEAEEKKKKEEEEEEELMREMVRIREEEKRRREEEERRRKEEERRRAEMEVSEGFIEGSTKGCPKCTRRIEKNGGCDHMSCLMCKHEFCWLCFADYIPIRKEGNHFHKESCRYYA